MTISRRLVISFLAAVSGIAGCTTVGENQSTTAEKRETRQPGPIASAHAPERGGESAKSLSIKNEGDLLKLPAHEVRESAFCDFGMSVKTNLEVKWGGDVEWMLVIGVDAGSSAAKLDLKVGDRILAIDGKLVSELSRDAMLAALFQRKKGDRVQFLVLGFRQALPRFVTLTANRVAA